MDFGRILSRIKSAVSIPSGLASGPDGFPLDPASPHYAIHRRINEFLVEVPDFTSAYRIKPSTYASGRGILEASGEEKLTAIEAMMLRRAWVHKNHPHSLATSFEILRKLTQLLWRRELPWTAERAASLLGILSSQMRSTHWFDEDLLPVLKICERLKAQNGFSPNLVEALVHLKASMNPGSRWESAARKRAREAIDRLRGPEQAPPVEAGEAWSNAARQELTEMSAEARSDWLSLLYHCLTAASSQPAQKWRDASQILVEAVGSDEFKTRVIRWFELVALPRPVHREARFRHQPDPDLLLTDQNASILKGLAWSCAGRQDKDITRALARLAEACFRKVPNLGARCPRVGNACLYSLSVTTTNDAAAELTRLNLLIKQPSTRKLLGKSLDKAAESTGRTREELEETTVPTYGLDAEGRLRQAVGDFTAEFCLSGSDAFQLLWRKSDGKIQKAVPTEVKENHETELKALKRTLQDIEKMLAAQRQRLERLLLYQREWEFETWRKRYLEHPVVGHFSRRLIWHYRQDERTAASIWHDGRLVDSQDNAVDWLSPKTRVRLWHPLGQEAGAVLSWRRWLETHQVTQPFKQAHREIYILTDAEQQTGTYSNRFGAHIIRQHQFAALAKERGWTYRLQGAFDSHNTPTLLLPTWELAIQFWVDPPGGNEDTSQAGIYLHLATDQVRFCDPMGTARVLSEVPALVFSEVMRDVDLFVGVCSIGNDPNWADRGEAGPHGGYWYGYAFGELSTTAKTRHDVLERLLPRLKIASQCTLHDRFLVVRGSLRTYKIHLGSSNILMEPNDRYLCIVPDRSRAATSNAQQIFLPFEGDSALAVILSKAFLLADDSIIKDQSILNQIKG